MRENEKSCEGLAIHQDTFFTSAKTATLSLFEVRTGAVASWKWNSGSDIWFTKLMICEAWLSKTLDI